MPVIVMFMLCHDHVQLPQGQPALYMCACCYSNCTTVGTGCAATYDITRNIKALSAKLDFVRLSFVVLQPMLTRR